MLSTMACFSQLPAAVESKGGWNHPVTQFHLPLIAWHFSQSCAGHMQHYVDMSGTILHLVCEHTIICQFSWNNSFQFVMAVFWQDCWSVRLILLTPCSLGLFFLCYSSRILLVYNYYSLSVFFFFKKAKFRPLDKEIVKCVYIQTGTSWLCLMELDLYESIRYLISLHKICHEM